MNQNTATGVDLSIVYVNWNSTALLCESIASVVRNPPDLRYEIIVVDNASPNGDVGLVGQLFPSVIVLEIPTNVGFGAANNLGFKRTIGSAILFLNPDTKIIASALVVLHKRLYALPNPGILGCRLLNADGSVQTSAIQTFPTILNQVLDIEALRQRWPSCSLWRIDPLFHAGQSAFAVEVISGACMMVKRTVFEAIGMFTEDYFMYAEDLDLCRKSMSAGYTNWFVAGPNVLHYGGQSSNGGGATRAKWNAIVRYMIRYKGYVYTVLFRCALICAALIRLVVLAIVGIVAGTSKSTVKRCSSTSKWWIILRTMARPEAMN